MTSSLPHEAHLRIDRLQPARGLTETRLEAILACSPRGEAEPAPLALACGHLALGWPRFIYEAGVGYSTVDSPEGCGE